MSDIESCVCPVFQHVISSFQENIVLMWFLTLYCADRPRSFLDDFEFDIDLCNVNNVDSDHGDPVIVHLRCLCDFSLLRYKQDAPSVACSFRRYAAILLIGSSFGLFILGYFINMHIASDKGASISERSVLSFVLALFTKAIII